MGIKKVLIFGGTHGNEWTGIYLIKKYSSLLKNEFKNLDLNFIHANPEAFVLNKRFKDEDLNRAFEFVEEKRPHSYENLRAKEIKSLILDEECFVIDLHTTTSNLGSTLIVTQEHPLNFIFSSGVKNAKVIYSPDLKKKYLVSQSQTGVMIEVGPVAQGVLSAQVLHETLRILRELFTQMSVKKPTQKTLEVYEEVEDVYYPQSAGSIDGYIHEGFQGRDFQEISGDYTPFRLFSGEEVKKQTQEILYPIFINEAAYYPSKVAFTMCRKKILNLNASQN
jgi:succinylglutamate desuccinylase